jgi:predicted ribosome quality control (RQC) complex YloA/Tae2 family protein
VSDSLPGQDPLEDAKSATTSALTKARRRLQRRVEAIRGDIARGAEAEALATTARWFVAEASRALRGTRELTVTDWSTGEPRPLTFQLDPAKLPRDQIEAVFAHARRMQKGRVIAEARLAETAEKVARLDQALIAIESATSLEDIERATSQARGASAVRPGGDLSRPIRSPKREERTRLPYRTFQSSPGLPVYVGRGAADNDALTFRVARPRDLWLHAKGTSGAHVVLPLGKGKEPASEALVDAAHLAAHFSTQRDEPTVEVTYTLRGRVRKPRGSAPGLVVVDQGKTMWVRMEPDRLKRLLASEESAAGIGT